MLTRLKVSGFKNLVDVDVYFGPFTCIAGANGVGKSNLFDAIRFLSALADKPLVDAALSVRDEGGHSSDIRSLFHRVGNTHDEEITFEAEMIIAEKGVDDLGQEAIASSTFLKYCVKLAYRNDESIQTIDSLELIHEELAQINVDNAREHLYFPHTPEWRRFVVKSRQTASYISTEETGNQRVIKLHQDGDGTRSVTRLASTLPRTVLSATSATEDPTVLLARREIQSWRLLQLEPSSLRQPDEFSAPSQLGSDGLHLPATLYHLARSYAIRQSKDVSNHVTIKSAEQEVYGEVANRLSEVLDDVKDLWVERDEQRALLTIYVRDRYKTVYPARALSDGTLRMLALSTLQIDTEHREVLCLEEPENGIHPERIPVILELLRDIATDVRLPIQETNALRQVIINTHSPAVVSQVPDDSLLIAESIVRNREGQTFKFVNFAALPDTWRAQVPDAEGPVSRGKLMAYLNPVISRQSLAGEETRVIDREDLQLLLPAKSV